MLMLDTNMLSEIMRPEPDRKIANWIIRQPSDELFTAAVCQAEILSGLATCRTAVAAPTWKRPHAECSPTILTVASCHSTPKRLLLTPRYSQRAGRLDGPAGP